MEELDSFTKFLTALGQVVALVPDWQRLAAIAILGLIPVSVLVMKALPNLGQKTRDDIAKFLVRYVFAGAGLICFGSFAWAIETGLSERASIVKGITKSEISGPNSQSGLASPLPSDSVEQVAGDLVALSRRMNSPPGMSEALVRLKEGDAAPIIAVIQNELLPTLEEKPQEVQALGWIGTLGFYSDTKSALEAYQKIITLDPNNARALAKLAFLRDRLGMPAEAAAAADKARDIAAKEGDNSALGSAYAALGAISLRKGDYQLARGDLEQARTYFRDADAQQDFATATLGLARTYYSEQGDYDVAKKLYEEALDVFTKTQDDRGATSALLGLADIAVEKGDTDTARMNYADALNRTKRSDNLDQQALAWSGLGRISSRQQDFVTAEKDHKEALALRQELQDQLGVSYEYSSLAKIAVNRKKYAEAADYYLKAINSAKDISPFAEAVHQRGLGTVYYYQDQWPQALEAFNRALELDKKLKLSSYSAVDMRWIGELYRLLNQKPDACQEWADAEQLFRDSRLAADADGVGERMKSLNCPS
jgi:tetratricopeptide (TPR) repeat protein